MVERNKNIGQVDLLPTGNNTAQGAAMAAQTLHHHEKRQFIKLFKQDHIDRFDERLVVLEAFLKTEHHVTVGQLTQTLNAGGYQFSEVFISETIELMCRYGFAQKNRFDNGELRFEHRHLGQHHDHMVCTKCKNIIEFENQTIEQLQLKIASEFGFHLLQHKLELYGICRACLDIRDQLIGLNQAKAGEKLIIKNFNCGVRARLRLLSMGLRAGDQIEVISTAQRGQLVVAVDFKRLVLGHGLAEKIQVAPLGESSISQTNETVVDKG
ncbi:MAG: Fur family transcriptional regulator [Desulfobacteraceae bacterium]|nr:Fur family transcriptional regulator [Desulfobacteraceae bacterium]